MEILLLKGEFPALLSIWTNKGQMKGKDLLRNHGVVFAKQ